MPQNYGNPVGIPPYQINSDPYLTHNTVDIMREVMKSAMNTENNRSNQRQYWQGNLPLAYNEAIRDQYNKAASGVAQGNLDLYQTAFGNEAKLREELRNNPTDTNLQEALKNESSRQQDAWIQYKKNLEGLQRNPIFGTPTVNPANGDEWQNEFKKRIQQAIQSGYGQ